MWSDQLAVRDAEWKLTFTGGTPDSLYWTARDPGERWNRIRDEAARRQALVERSGPYLKLQKSINAEKIEEALRAIGYIR